ncbi:MAG: lamin tail domain-containing protein [Myxococcales bacterium]|nr:lamin tail domain-containing protein [Myxococcales bacterium]
MSRLDLHPRPLSSLWSRALLLALPMACSDPPVPETETETETDTEGTGTTTISPTTGPTTDPGTSTGLDDTADDSTSGTTEGDTDTFGGVCGDGILDPGEACDGDDYGGQTCQTQGFDGGLLACNVQCEIVTAGCDACGDGIVDPGEQCDGSDLAGQDCALQGFGGGTLACDRGCFLDTSGCWVCGNEVLDPGEACDGFELDGQDCASQGFDAGILACDAACAFDTSGCYLCGDGNLDPGEACDGADLGGETCASQGFDDGVLGCTETCVLDVGGCISFSCGDGVVNGADQCDAMDLDGQTCMSLGFGAGTLGCTAGCAFETSACCGDGTIGGAEACDGASLGGQTCASEGFDGGTLGCAADCSLDTSGCYACGDGSLDPGEACDGANLGGQTCEGLGMGLTGGLLACDAACAFDTGGCTSFPRPVAGQLVFSEVMKDPVTVADGMGGEWVELHNPTGAIYQLEGCTLDVVAPPASVTIDADLVAGVGAYLGLAETSGGGPGFAPAWSWPAGGLPLPDGAGELQLHCDGVLVDAVAYDAGATFPSTPGAALSLDPLHLDAVDNDAGANWCDASAAYNGDLGSPGQPNPPCDPTYSIDFCRLQFPLVVDAPAGSLVTVYGRLYIAGLTDQSPFNEPASTVLAWVGYGPDGTDPGIDPTWTWIAGVPNPGWDGNLFGEPNNDEYQAELVVPAPGTYDFAYRFSGDLGATFTYCDGDPPGNTNGYDVGQAGQLTSTP